MPDLLSAVVTTVPSSAIMNDAVEVSASARAGSASSAVG